MESPTFTLPAPLNEREGNACAVDIVPGIVAVGTDKGGVHVYTYGGGRHVLRPYLNIPPPPSHGMSVVTCKISLIGNDKACVFVAYRRTSSASSPRSTAGVCCYEMPLPGPNPTQISAPSARHDLDGRHVPSSSLCDAVATRDSTLFTVVSKQFSGDDDMFLVLPNQL